MKRRMQLITAFLLMLTMAVSGTYVFAGTSDEPGDVQGGLEVTEPAPDQSVDLEGAPELEAAPEGVESEDSEEVEGPVDAAGAVDATDEVEPPAAVKGAAKAVEPEAAEELGEVEPMTWVDNKLKATTLTYNTTKRDPGEDLPCYGDNIYHCYYITVGANGKLFANVKADSSNTYGVNVALGTFDETTSTFTQLHSPRYISPGENKTGIGGVDVVAGRTYCVGIEASRDGLVNVQPYVYSYATRTLPAGLMMLTSNYKGDYVDSAALFQIKPKKTGYIRVTAKEYGYSTSAGYVTLLNAKKKAVSDKLWYYSSSKTSYVAFGVKKGVTYYLKANGLAGTESYYGIQYKVYGSTLRKNTTKKKAKTLKRKAKFISTAIPANGKKGNQWYKFKVPKKQATQIRINMANVKSGKIKATVYYGKKKVASTSLVNGTTNTLKLTYSTTYGKAKKGTYYLKLSKSAKTNGSYKIRYLK